MRIKAAILTNPPFFPGTPGHEGPHYNPAVIIAWQEGC